MTGGRDIWHEGGDPGVVAWFHSPELSAQCPLCETDKEHTKTPAM